MPWQIKGNRLKTNGDLYNSERRANSLVFPELIYSFLIVARVQKTAEVLAIFHEKWLKGIEVRSSVTCLLL